MNIDFCPELQLDWRIESISFSNLEHIKVVAFECDQVTPPSPMGRSVKDVVSWPTIFTQLKEVEFCFNECVYFNVREDITPGLSENDLCDGKTFQRLLESELLKLNSDRMRDNLHHYRII